jgi:hypothetical protein
MSTVQESNSRELGQWTHNYNNLYHSAKRNLILDAIACICTTKASHTRDRVKAVEPARAHVCVLAPPVLQPRLQPATSARRSASASSAARTGGGSACARARNNVRAQCARRQRCAAQASPRPRVPRGPRARRARRSATYIARDEHLALTDPAQTGLVERVDAERGQHQRVVAARPGSAAV